MNYYLQQLGIVTVLSSHLVLHNHIFKKNIVVFMCTKICM